MDLKEKPRPDPGIRPSSSVNEPTKETFRNNRPFPNFNSARQQKWEDTSILDYGIRTEPTIPEFNQPSESPASLPSNPNNKIKIPDGGGGEVNETWDPRAMLTNLSFLEQKIHQLQDLVHLIVGRRGQALGRPDEMVTQQQQLITADLTSIIIQLISTAGSLLPSVKNTLCATDPSVGQLGQLAGLLFPSGTSSDYNGGSKILDQATQDLKGNYGIEQNYATEEHESKDEDDVDEGENLPPGSYEILQIEKEEILAPHTHFCMICGKGFKRDANLRMHMRGHGDEYKTPAALAKPNKEASSEPVLIKRYSCPYPGCKRNKDHKKFQPLKTILCVKNHYKRTHCDKSYTCSRCNTKKFSVIADLKTHEKHCGRDKWLCSCGTTFSRKDKLFGHIALFQGHTPILPHDEAKLSAGPSDRGESNEEAKKVGSMGFDFGSNTFGGDSEMQDVGDAKGSVDEPVGYFSPLNFDTCNFSGFHEFPRPPFEDSDSSFSFLNSGSCNFIQKSEGKTGSNDLE